MSYQIRSTPYFRRMFNNSKKNGQLQRLREEYERIQEFNDRTIELKMRQVRLKRLFREIEEIKETSSPTSSSSNGANTSNSSPGPLQCKAATRHRPNMLAGGSNVERKKYNQRLEALARAKELGKEISRRNAELAEAGAGGFFRNELRMTAKMQAVADARREAVERRERAAKRISYGNAQSKHNLQRQVHRRQKRLGAGLSTDAGGVNSLLKEGERDSSSSLSGSQMIAPINSSCTQHPDLYKRERLQQRLNYGNIRYGNSHSQRAANCMPVSPKSISDAEGEQILGQKHDQRIDCLPRRAARFTASSTTMEFHDNLTMPDHIQDLEVDEGSDAEMQTAPLAPNTDCTEKDPLELCCKETRILRRNVDTDDVSNMNEDGITLSATIAAYQPPLTVPHRTHDDVETFQASSQASARWRQISLTLPWLKVFQNRRSISSNEISKTKIVAPSTDQVTESNPVSSSYEDFSHNACLTSTHLGTERFRGGDFWEATQRVRRDFILPSQQEPTEQTEQSYCQVPKGYDLAQLHRAIFDQ